MDMTRESLKGVAAGTDETRMLTVRAARTVVTTASSAAGEGEAEAEAEAEGEGEGEGGEGDVERGGEGEAGASFFRLPIPRRKAEWRGGAGGSKSLQHQPHPSTLPWPRHDGQGIVISTSRPSSPSSLTLSPRNRSFSVPGNTGISSHA